MLECLILISDGPGEANKLAFFAPKSWPPWPLAQILWGALAPLAPPLPTPLRSTINMLKRNVNKFSVITGAAINYS